MKASVEWLKEYADIHVSTKELADRLTMTELTIENSAVANKLCVCDVEFGMPRPSYTIDTLHLLTTKYPDIEFMLLIGSDIVSQFRQWKLWQEIVANYKIFVYPRSDYESKKELGINFHFLDAPVLLISSTQIRKIIECRGSIENLITKEVAEYIVKNNLYCEITADYYLSRGKANYAKGKFGDALNDFIRAQELGDKDEAVHFEELIRSILEFRYTDIYNP